MLVLNNEQPYQFAKDTWIKSTPGTPVTEKSLSYKNSQGKRDVVRFSSISNLEINGHPSMKYPQSCICHE